MSLPVSSLLVVTVPLSPWLQVDDRAPREGIEVADHKAEAVQAGRDTWPRWTFRPRVWRAEEGRGRSGFRRPALLSPSSATTEPLTTLMPCLGPDLKPRLLELPSGQGLFLIGKELRPLWSEDEVLN